MREDVVQVSLPSEDVAWAIETARQSAGRWGAQTGHYTNALRSHFIGKLGELAAARALLARGLRLDAHFRHPEREALCDVVVKQRGYRQITRIEIKTWSRAHWPDLGRCIAVAQLPALAKKADCILWCVTDAPKPDADPAPVEVEIAGWSTLDEVRAAPIRFTGTGAMRRVQNHQLDVNHLHPFSTFLKETP
ncbi:MAG: hypothetical protein WHV44_02645 [Anaerolineales bacterium]